MTEKTKAALYWILDRLSESSTWRGIVLTITGLGITLNPDYAAKITAAGLAVVGVINIFRTGAPTKTQVAEALDAKQDKPL
jgi:hypothetical protein